MRYYHELCIGIHTEDLHEMGGSKSVQNEPRRKKRFLCFKGWI
jgi:hypothetical protein